MMNILITDDHPNVRRGLRELLIDSFPGSEFFEACNGDEVFAQLLLSRPDLMLLDINMPGRSGFEVLKDVRKSHPRLPVIMVSVQPRASMRCAVCRLEQLLISTRTALRKNWFRRSGKYLRTLQSSRETRFWITRAVR